MAGYRGGRMVELVRGWMDGWMVGWLDAWSGEQGCLSLSVAGLIGCLTANKYRIQVNLLRKI